MTPWTWAVRELEQLRTNGADLAELERAAAAESDLGRRADRYPNAVATRTDLLVLATGWKRLRGHT